MKNVPTTIALGFLFCVVSASGQSRYGLGCYGDACTVVDEKAESRMVNARTICGSGDTSILYPKKNKPSADEMAIYWRDIHAAERVAESSYREVSDCAKADLVVKITIDTLSDSISLLVTDGDSGDSDFSETRTVQDKRSDLIHAAQHFRDAVKSARSTAEAEQTRLAEEYRYQQEAEATKREQQKCQTEFASLKQDIIAYTEVQHTEVPSEIQQQIASHNSRCTNPISVEVVQQQQRTEAEAKADQERAANEQAFREKRKAQLEKEKADALVAYTHQISDAPFVPPAEGWTHEVGLGTARWYIILPGTGLTSNCHLAMNGSHPALDCLGSQGRNDYVSVINNSRWYLLRAKRINAGEHASSVKDGGSTLCLRQVGCYHVLAEARQEPTELPEKLQVPAPTNSIATYSSDEIAFDYTQNWRAEERKNRDNIVTQVNVAPPEGHLANWVTHGFFCGHVLKIGDKFPQTLDGAYDQFSAYERLRGLTVANPQMQTVGDSRGKLATYTAPSVLRAGESGWVVVVKDKSDGYYYLLMFYPSNDDASLYAQTFNKVLASFKFKK
jgi:hypothetical protein